MAQLASSSPASQEIDVFWRSDGEFAPSLVSEISRSGAFVKTPKPAPMGATVQLRIDAPGREICAQAVVRRVAPGQGMAVEFETIADDDRVRLDAMIQRIEAAHGSQAARPVAPAAPAVPPAPPVPAAVPVPRATPIPKPAEAHVPAAAPEPRNRGVDRRTRFRHKFAAPVRITQSGSGQTVQAQLSDLGKGGCFVKLEKPFPVGVSLEITITENGQSFQARANVVSSQPGNGMGLMFTVIDPTQHLVLDGWLATSMERKWLASSRRRSQRVMVSIPVQVRAKNAAGLDLVEDTKTVSVSAHGALLRLEIPVNKGQSVTLRNPANGDSLECSVVYLGGMQDGRREVGVSFIQPNKTLWRIAFPPADWSPQHPDAKS
jgi:PilZ domain-containing protein